MSAPLRITVLAEDLATGTIIGEIPATDITFGETLCGPGGWSKTLDGHHRTADPAALRPGGLIVHVLDPGGQPISSGICWSTDWADGQVQLGGQGIWSYFRETDGRDRVYRGGIGGMAYATDSAGGGAVFTAVEQMSIAQDLIGWAQADPYGDLGVTVRFHPAGGSGGTRMRTYEPWERISIGGAIEAMAACENGFEFRACCEWDGNTLARYLDLWYPMLGSRKDIVWEHGSDITITDLPSRVGANRVDALGAGDDASKLIRSATSIPVGTIRHDRVISHTDVSVAATLLAHAEGELARADGGVDTIRFSLDRLSAYPLGSWSVGDQVRLVADDGWCRQDGTVWWRIMGWDATVDDTGTMSVTVDAAARVSTGRPLLLPADERARRNRDLARRVATIEGR